MIAKSKNWQTCDKPKSESINDYSLRKANTKSQQRKSKIIYFFVVYFKKEFIHLSLVEEHTNKKAANIGKISRAWINATKNKNTLEFISLGT